MNIDSTEKPMPSSARVLLVGMGADIGSNLLCLSAMGHVANPITDVLTHPVESEGPGAEERGSLEELKTRLLLANPQLFGKIKTDSHSGTLSINERVFRIHLRDLDDDLTDLGAFDLAILATSRRHVRSKHYLDKLEALARVVIGAAENAEIPALYPALLTADQQHFTAARRVEAREIRGSYAMGSCQCAGWTTGLRILAEFCASRNVDLHTVLVHSEVDIVHPDTASSNFGTHRVGSRSEDPRDNLRPGISQVAESMQRFAPATSANTVSLRVLTQPPGYQIQRFFLHELDASPEDLINVAKKLEAGDPRLIHVTHSPVGSRVYAHLPSTVVLLATEQHLSVKRIGNLTEVVFQAYVHNTLGYCAGLLSATDHLLRGDDVTFVDATVKAKK